MGTWGASLHSQPHTPTAESGAAPPPRAAFSTQRSDSSWIVRDRSGRASCPPADVPICPVHDAMRFPPSPPPPPARPPHPRHLPRSPPPPTEVHDVGQEAGGTSVIVAVAGGFGLGLLAACGIFACLWRLSSAKVAAISAAEGVADRSYSAWPAHQE